MSFAKSKMESHFGALSGIEFVLLQTIAIHGLVTNRVWKELASLDGLPSQDVSGAMRSLTNRKIVAARTLHHGQNYFAFTKDAVMQLGLPQVLGNPLSEKSKLRAYARLIFFVRHRPGFVKLTKSELEAKLCQPCPWATQRFLWGSKQPAIHRFRKGRHSHPQHSRAIIANTSQRRTPVRHDQTDCSLLQGETTRVHLGDRHSAEGGCRHEAIQRIRIGLVVPRSTLL